MRGVKFHQIYISIMVLTVILVSGWLAYNGYAYYSLGLEDRFFNPDHQMLKASGFLGHGLGIIGSVLIVIGVASYMLRKRIRRLARFGLLKYWLEFHIFLCVLGPILVLYHTSFKFGGIVAISFWSMVAVVLSGLIGRYIYLQIPRTIEGREMNLNEINQNRVELSKQLSGVYKLDNQSLQTILEKVKERPDRSGENMLKRSFQKFRFEQKTIREVRNILKKQHFSRKNISQVMSLIRSEINLNRKIDRLITMQNLFKYWHVAHLPFAILMLIIMIVHVIVTVTFGARWIF